MQRKCHACGVTFTVHGDCQTKCELCTAGVSRDGRMVYGYVPPKEEKPKELPKGFKACEICGVVFKSNNKTRKTCSYGCREERARRMKEGRKIERKPSVHEATCIICGSQFTTRRYNQNVCSDKCSKEKARRALREYRKRCRDEAKAVD